MLYPFAPWQHTCSPSARRPRRSPGSIAARTDCSMPRCATSSGMYEVGAAIDVRALHVMPGADGPEGLLHAHDYRIEVIVEREELDEHAMVCDLDVLEAALGAAADNVRDVDLEVIRPADAEAVTVEVFARWAHGAIAQRVR